MFVSSATTLPEDQLKTYGRVCCDEVTLIFSQSTEPCNVTTALYFNFITLCVSESFMRRSELIHLPYVFLSLTFAPQQLARWPPRE